MHRSGLSIAQRWRFHAKELVKYVDVLKQEKGHTDIHKSIILAIRICNKLLKRKNSKIAKATKLYFKYRNRDAKKAEYYYYQMYVLCERKR